MGDKVGFIFIGDSVGGAFYSSIANVFEGQRFTFIVIVLFHNEIIASACKRKQIEYHCILEKKINKISIMVISRLLKVVKRLNINIIQGNDIRSNLLCCLLSKLLRVKFLWCQRSLLNRSVKSLIPLFFADQVVVPSIVVRDSFHQAGRKKIRVVPNSIQINKLRNQSKNCQKKIFIIGRVVPERGVEKLINHLVTFADSITNVALPSINFIGAVDEAYLRELKSNIPLDIMESFSFRGFCEDPWRYVCEGDIIINGCEREAFGRTIWEFGCYGCEILVPKQNLALIPREFWSRFLTFGSADEFCSKLKFALEVTEVVSGKPTKFREMVKDALDSKVIYAKYESIYDEIKS
jgi:glycosyltransferase involved in cell wall biosynthesis